jgi:hypothetical protein
MRQLSSTLRLCTLRPITVLAVSAAGRPTIVMICAWPAGGDPDLCPCAWRCLPAVKDWAAAALVCTYPAAAEMYRSAVAAALQVGRLAFVLTGRARAEDWAVHLAAKAL